MTSPRNYDFGPKCGCNFKRSNAEAVKKHEDECEYRYVPCAECDEKIRLRGLAQHVVEKHYKGLEFKANSFGDTLPLVMQPSSDLKKDQAVISVDDGYKFLLNWCSLDDNFTLFWAAYIGQNSLSSNYKYTIQVQRSKDEPWKYVYEGTRECIPCDLSHTDVKNKKSALVLDKGLIDDATKEDDMLHYTLTIDES